MLINVPAESDFFEDGKVLIFKAWEKIISLIDQFQGGESQEEFWEGCRVDLSMALATAQQGAELLIKGRIAEISPYLLLKDSSEVSRGQSKSNDIDFRDLKTHDSTDLIKLHNRITSFNLDDQFSSVFGSARVERNKFMHSLIGENTQNAARVLEYCIYIHEMFSKDSWLTFLRSEIKRNIKISWVSHEGAECAFGIHIKGALRIFGNTARQKIGFNAKDLKFSCPRCRGNYHHEKTGFRPVSNPGLIECFICNESFHAPGSTV